MNPNILETLDHERFSVEDALLYPEVPDVMPEEVIHRILAGVHPVKVFREYRRFSPRELAQKVGVSYHYLMQVENGRLHPTSNVLKKLARALRVNLQDIA